MNLIQQEIEKNKAKIKELQSECKAWENYNKIENNLLRDEIKNIKKLNKKYQKIKVA